MKTLQTLLTIGNTYVDARGKRPDFLHDSFCNLPLMRRTYDVELSIWTLKNLEKNREWKENFVLPLSKIESRKRILSYHSRKSRVEREMETIKFSRSREKFLFLLSIFLSRARLLSMPGILECETPHRVKSLGGSLDPLQPLWKNIKVKTCTGHAHA